MEEVVDRTQSRAVVVAGWSDLKDYKGASALIHPFHVPTRSLQATRLFSRARVYLTRSCSPGVSEWGVRVGARLCVRVRARVHRRCGCFGPEHKS